MKTKILKLFRSVKLTAILLFILSVLIFASIFLAWIPGDSIWFLAIIGLLLINIGACIFNRRKSILSESKKAKVKSAPEFYSLGEYHFESKSKETIEFIDGIMNKTAKKHRYSLTKEGNEGCILIAGDKHRYSGFGTYAVHLSLFVLIIGIATGTLLGFRNNDFVVCEETGQDVGNNTGLSLYLKSFTDDYWENGTPKDFQSEVVLFDHGVEVEKKIIRVNHPMIYQGIRFHQSTFGPAVKMKIADLTGNLIFDYSVPLTEIRTDYSFQRPEGLVEIGREKYSIKIVGNALHGADPAIGENEIGIELYNGDMEMIAWAKLQKSQTQILHGMEITYVDSSQYSGFLVSKDPGVYLIWLAFFLFILGMVMIFYFPHRQIWIAVFKMPDSGTRLLIKLSSSKDLGVEKELENIISDYETAIGAKEKSN